MRRLIVPLAAVVLALSMAAPAAAVPATLDQAQELYTTPAGAWGSVYTFAQTFQAGMTGTLVSMDLYIQVQKGGSATPDPGDDLRVQVWPVDDATGFPSDTSALVDVSVRATWAIGWNEIDLASGPTLTKDESYAIVVTTTSGNFVGWGGQCASDNYELGRALIFDPRDQQPTWMTLPAWRVAHDGASWVCWQDYAFRTYMAPSASASSDPSAAASSAAPSAAASSAAPSAAASVAASAVSSAAPSSAASHAPTITAPPTTTTGNGSGGGGSLIGFLVLAALAAGGGIAARRSNRELGR